MSGLFGGDSTVAQQAAPIGALRVQTSSFGTAIPLTYGQARVTGNLIWYNDFQSQSHNESGGGKGGTHSGSVSYTYTAALMIALGEGVYGGIGNIWQQKDLISSDPQSTQTNTANEFYTIPSNGTIVVEHADVFISAQAVYYGQDQGDPNATPPDGTAAGTPGAYSLKPFTEVNSPTGIALGEFYVDLNQGVRGTFTFSQGDVGKQITIGYNYTAATKAVDPLGALNMVFFNGGSDNLTPWGYLTTSHPDQVLYYKGLSFVASPQLDLKDSPDTPNYSFELQGMLPYNLTLGITDANPADVVQDYLTNPQYGVPGFPALYIADLTLYRSYCAAAEIFLSWWTGDQGQQSAADHLKMICEVSNSAPVWSGSQLKIIPYGEVQLVGPRTGVTYTPNSTPVYDLTDDHFVDLDEPVKITRTSPQDAYNSVQVEYCDRANDYNIQIVEARDASAVDQYGLLYADPYQAHCLADMVSAQTVAQLMLQRSLYIRNTYEFRLDLRFCLLEPMDLVTLTDSRLGLSKTPVLITSIEEDQDGIRDVIAEDWVFGTATASKYGSQEASSFFQDRNLPAGNANTPVIFEPTFGITGGDLQVWIGANGGDNWAQGDVWLSQDNAEYKRIGNISAPSRTGYVVATLPVGTDPDKINSLLVDINQGGGQLISGTQADADQLHTLCWVDGEFVAYQTATLKGPGRYALGYLRRGAYGSPIAQHAAQTPFIRCDDSIFKYTYDKSLIGTQVYIKILGINSFGGGAQSLDEVQPYTYKINGTSASALASGGTIKGKPGSTTSAGVTVTYDARGNAIITIPIPPVDPTISAYQMRTGGSSFASSNTIYAPSSPDGSQYTLPLTAAIGNTFYIAGLYSAAAGGGVTANVYTVSFNANGLPAIASINVRIAEPNIDFTWPAVPGASQYAVYFTEGGVSSYQLVSQPEVLIQIPKYSASIRVIAIDADGDSSPPYDEAINETGLYTLEEIVNLPLVMNTGKYVNMCFNNASMVEKPSALGVSVFTSPPANINSAMLFTRLENFGSTVVSSIGSVPLSWWRDQFWEQQNGYFESAVIDLGAVLSGRIKLNLTTTVTFNGNTVNGFGDVLLDTIGDNTIQDLIDPKAFLQAQFYVSTDASLQGSNWQLVNDGDFITGMRYAKVVVTALSISPLTDCVVTAGAITLDVPPITESGKAVGVNTSTVVNLTNKYHAITSISLTARSNVGAWESGLSVNAGTGAAQFNINVSAGPADVYYFVKGY